MRFVVQYARIPTAYNRWESMRVEARDRDAAVQCVHHRLIDLGPVGLYDYRVVPEPEAPEGARILDAGDEPTAAELREALHALYAMLVAIDEGTSHLKGSATQRRMAEASALLDRFNP